MFYPREAKLSIPCPSTGNRKTRTVFVYFTMNEGKPLPLLCNGCDDMSGSKTCMQCCADVQSMCFNNPDLISPDPVFLFP